jgi:peroxiredoxin
MPTLSKTRLFSTALSTLRNLSAVLCIFIFSACHLNTQETMPSFHVSELSGKTITQEELKGKVSVINFWATSCTVCVKEMPEMKKVYEKHSKNGLLFLAVAMAYDPPMYVADFTKTRQLPFIVAMDSDGNMAKAFGKIQLTPTTLVVNKNGKIIRRYVGEPDWEEFNQILEKALTENSKGLAGI